MTNREWLNTLSDEEFVEIMIYSCRSCVGDGSLEKCHRQPSCKDGKLKWLHEKHKENNNDQQRMA